MIIKLILGVVFGGALLMTGMYLRLGYLETAVRPVAASLVIQTDNSTQAKKELLLNTLDGYYQNSQSTNHISDSVITTGNLLNHQLTVEEAGKAALYLYEIRKNAPKTDGGISESNNMLNTTRELLEELLSQAHPDKPAEKTQYNISEAESYLAKLYLEEFKKTQNQTHFKKADYWRRKSGWVEKQVNDWIDQHVPFIRP